MLLLLSGTCDEQKPHMIHHDMGNSISRCGVGNRIAWVDRAFGANVLSATSFRGGGPLSGSGSANWGHLSLSDRFCSLTMDAADSGQESALLRHLFGVICQ